VNRNQAVAAAVAAANLLLVLLFLPLDQYSIAASKLPVFAGFHFALALPANSEVNTDMLWIELAVILINTGIAWLLLRDRPPAASRFRIGMQNAVLIFTGVNLLLAVLFPPFESVFALTQAILPNFEGFYFVFGQKPNHVIVTTLLYIEVSLILVNGSILWLLFRGQRSGEPTAEELQALASRMREGGR